MLLRVLLVGMVTSLGLELPTGQEVDAWSRAGRDWCQTRLAEWDASLPTNATALVTVPAPTVAVAADVARNEGATQTVEVPRIAEIATTSPIAQTVEIAPIAEAEAKVVLAADLTFIAVMEESVNAFAAESFAEEAAAVLASLPLPREEPGVDPLVAMELGREAERPIEAAMVEAVATLNGPTVADAAGLAPASVPEPAVAIAAMPGHTRGERLAAALRLTSQAVRAWAGLLQGAATLSLNP